MFGMTGTGLERAEDDVLLAKWLQRSQKDYISPQIQNEILSTMSNNVVSGIADTIRDLPVLQYAVIMNTRHFRARTRKYLPALC